MQHFDDHEIIKGIEKADEDVLKYVYQRYFGAVKRIVQQNGGTEDDAWDAFQDSLNSVIDIIREKGNAFLTNATFETFLLELSKRYWLKSKRHKQHFLDAGFRSDELPDPDTHPDAISEEDYFENVMLRFFKRHIERLSPTCRQLIMLQSGNEKKKAFLKISNLGSLQALYNKRRACIRKLLQFIHNDPEYKNLLKNGKPWQN